MCNSASVVNILYYSQWMAVVVVVLLQLISEEGVVTLNVVVVNHELNS